ncbi:hypothetical protein [Nocardia cyriacigeorgica]|uniref:hypothetical protein n=1 Tax=Nocardia cyriacigeorgica TaxID=135487 RepID=UPI0018958803|nr:hypothetical protein [Nocardia cyriacigeorgica]MBF6416933.1 hypothetical protein [Nocardia cyriacigeorgica]
MTPEEIRAQAIEVIERAEHDGWLSGESLAEKADRVADALAAAGLLPTGAEEGYIGRSRRRRQRYVTDWREITTPEPPQEN